MGLPLLRLVAGDDRRQRRGAPQLRPRVAGRERRAVGGGGLWRREDEVEGALLLQHAEAGRAAPPETCLRRRLELLKSDGIVMQENVHLYERTMLSKSKSKEVLNKKRSPTSNSLILLMLKERMLSVVVQVQNGVHGVVPAVHRQSHRLPEVLRSGEPLFLVSISISSQQNFRYLNFIVILRFLKRIIK